MPSHTTSPSLDGDVSVNFIVTVCMPLTDRVQTDWACPCKGGIERYACSFFHDEARMLYESTKVRWNYL